MVLFPIEECWKIVGSSWENSYNFNFDVIIITYVEWILGNSVTFSNKWKWEIIPWIQFNLCSFNSLFIFIHVIRWIHFQRLNLEYYLKRCSDTPWIQTPSISQNALNDIWIFIQWWSDNVNFVSMSFQKPSSSPNPS